MYGLSREVRDAGDVKLVDCVSREWIDMELLCSLWRDVVDIDVGMWCASGQRKRYGSSMPDSRADMASCVSRSSSFSFTGSSSASER